jgi:nitrate reductase beta subunit
MNCDILQSSLIVNDVADCDNEDDYAYHRDDTVDTRPSEKFNKQVYKKTENAGDGPENGSGKTKDDYKLLHNAVVSKLLNASIEDYLIPWTKKYKKLRTA